MKLLEVEQVIEKKRTRRWLPTLISIGIAAFIAVLLLHTVSSNWAVLTSQPITFVWLPLILAFGTYVVDLFLAIWVWHRLGQRILGVRDWRRNSRVYLSTLLARRLPGSFWHFLGRAQIYSEDGIPKSISSVGSAVEFVVFFLSGGVLYIALLPWLRGAQISSWVFLCFLPLGLLLLFPRSVKWLTIKIFRVPTSLAIQRRDLVEWIFFDVLVWGVGGILLYLVINSFYVLPVEYVPNVIAAWTLATMIGMIAVFTPAGLGVREITLSALLTPFVVPPFNVIIAVMVRIIVTVFDFICAGIGYAMFKIGSG
ncbi:hypothetical protein TFLX_04488 [Thermoflexales bacterium]|nr:hypothetical protein TFLX_04488 [Thermoflexales bacterium]